MDADRQKTTFRPGPAPGDVADAIRSALSAAKDAAHDAYECDLDHAGIAARAVEAFLRALPDRFPMARPGGQTWGHAHGEMAKLAAMVEGIARG